jgi:hypothetical protein
MGQNPIVNVNNHLSIPSLRAKWDKKYLVPHFLTGGAFFFVSRFRGSVQDEGILETVI